MKRIKGLYGFMAISMLIGAMTTSCTNNLNDMQGNSNGVALNGSVVKTPDVIVWSGNQTFGNSFTGTRSDGYANSYVPVSRAEMDPDDSYDNNTESKIFWKEATTNLLNLAKESELVDEWLPEKSESSEHVNDIKVDFLYYAKDSDIEFEMYPVLSKSDRNHDIGIFYIEPGSSNTEYKKTDLLWSNLGADDINEGENGTLNGLKIKIKQGLKFGFYWINTDGTVQYQHFMGAPSYETKKINESFSYKALNLSADSPDAESHVPGWDATVRGGTFYNQGKTYIGFEDWTDFDFQDIVFTCDKILLMVDSEGNEYPTPSEDGKTSGVCKKCGHNHNGPSTDCSDCENDGPAEGYDGSCWEEGANTGGNGTMKPGKNEVEINLSILDVHSLPNGDQKYDIADLVSKLSMHVRYPHDIEVILPVPQSIYCDQDDLYILKTHDVGEYVYGGEKNELTYEIAGYTVKLGIEFVSADNDNLTDTEREVLDKDGNKIQAGGYIRVYTDGINEDLINFLKQNYGDGINFEVYNYYNRGTQYTTDTYPEITYECLQYNFLSHSFVNFDYNETGEKVLPDYYINAFNEINSLPVKGDCYTWIIGDEHANNGVYVENWSENRGQKASFANPYQGFHYNGSKYNWIYTIGGEDSQDMPVAIWPFNNNNSLWQYYKANGSDYFNFAPASNN